MAHCSFWKRAVPALLFAFSSLAQAQLYGTNSQSNNATTLPASAGLFTLNPMTGAIVAGTVITVPGRTITGATALTRDPTSGKIYAVVKDAVLGGNRILVTLNLATGVGVEVGPLGDSFSSLAFRADGQLFGMTGNGATVSKALWLINKTTAAVTNVQDLSGLGADGAIIAFNPTDSFFYFWTGNGALAFAKVQSIAPYGITVIPITGSTSGEIFGTVWDPTHNDFLVHNISDSMDFWTATGVRSNAQPATLTSVRGMVLFPPGAVPALSALGLGLLTMLILALAMTGRKTRFAQ